MKDLKKGQIIENEHVSRIRPGYGLHPKNYEVIIDKYCFSNSYKKGDRLSWDCIEVI